MFFITLLFSVLAFSQEKLEEVKIESKKRGIVKSASKISNTSIVTSKELLKAACWHLPEEDREPACVRTCPTNARHFGDFADPQSKVSKLVAERGGYDLMPGMATKPTNKYLPPRKKGSGEASPLTPLLDVKASGIAGWLDRMLGKI